MRIGRLRARLRRLTEPFVEQEYYYSRYDFFVAFGDLEAKIPPFDGKAFLDWDWHRQHNRVWHGHSVNGMIPAALIDYTPEWRKKTKENKENRCFFTFFSRSYDNIMVECIFNLEGAWIGGDDSVNTSYITVLRSTRLKAEFKAETREVLLPPGATIFLSPLPLMQKLGKNISMKKYERRYEYRLPPEVRKVFTSAKTPQKLAARLGLKPIRLREKLEDKGEVMRR